MFYAAMAKRSILEPMNLIKKTGNEVIEIPDGHICCGSAGTYNMLQSEIADKANLRKK